MSERKKICFVVSSTITVNAFLLNHIRVLSKDFDIHLVANMEGDLPVLTSDILSIKHIEIARPIHLWKDLRAVFQLTRYLYRSNFDAVHSVTPKAGLIGMLAAFFARVPNRVHIFTGQVWHTKIGIAKWVLKNIDSLIASLATKILVDGHSQRQFLIENAVLDSKKSEVLGKGSISGVVASKFQPDPVIRIAFRENWGFGDAEVIFAFLGRLNKDKGVFDLIQAFQLLNSKLPRTRLVLIGPDEEAVQEKVGELKAVSFLGHTAEPHKTLQMADVFCMPSYREGFGTSILEASLLGLPIICSDTYGLMETILDNETGLRHQVGNINSIASNMEKLATDSEMRVKMGHSGRNYVLNNFDANTISMLWLDFYHKLLDK